MPDTEDLNLFTIGETSSKPIFVDVKVNGEPLTMEVDTGAAVTVISDETCKSRFPDVPMRKSSVVLRTYTGQQMRVLGEMEVKVEYKDQEKSLCIIIVSGNGPSLLGRNWLKYIRLDWAQIAAVKAEQTSIAHPSNPC